MQARLRAGSAKSWSVALGHKQCCHVKKEKIWWLRYWPYLVSLSRRRSAMVCIPHKTGSQTWRYFFLKLNEKDDPENPSGYMFPQNTTSEAYRHFEHRVVQTRYSRLRNVTTDCFVPHAWFIHPNIMTKKWDMWFIQHNMWFWRGNRWSFDYYKSIATV